MKDVRKLVISAVVLLASLAAMAYGPELLAAEVPAWGMILLRLIALASGLSLASAAASLLFGHWLPKSGRGKTAFTLSNSAVRYILVIVGLLWGLAILGVNVQALMAGAGVAALIIGFGAESLIADVITGVFMLFEHQYEVGDIVVVGDFRGTVTQIGIRTTSIIDSGGNVQIINNSDIRKLINRSNDRSVAVCDIAIPYQGYLRRAEQILEKTLPKLAETYPDLFCGAPCYRGVQEMDVANDAVFLRITADVAEQNIYAAQRTLNRCLLLAFEDGEIPNPVSELKLAKE